MNKADRAYLDAVARDGCLLCAILGTPGTPGEIHHQRTGIGAGRRATHRQTVCLCFEHHRGATGLHGLGRKAFEKRYGITELDLIERTTRSVKQ